MLPNSSQMHRICKMKHTIIVSIFLFLSAIANAQDVLDTMAKETCECVTSKNLDIKNLSSEKLQMEFGVCAMQSYSKHKEAYDKVSPSDIGDTNSMRKLGESLAMKMLGMCPDVIMGLAKSDEDEIAAAPSPTVEGTVVEFVTEQFVTIKVKDKNQRLHNFIMLDYFDTASLYTDGLIRKKDQIVVTYSEIELFDPKVKEFRYYKVITGLEKK